MTKQTKLNQLLKAVPQTVRCLHRDVYDRDDDRLRAGGQSRVRPENTSARIRDHLTIRRLRLPQPGSRTLMKGKIPKLMQAPYS